MFSSGNQRWKAKAISHSTACLYETQPISLPGILCDEAGMEDCALNVSYLLGFMMQTT